MPENNTRSWVPYLAVMIVGAGIILLASFIQQESPAQAGEYYWSSFLQNNLTFPVKVVMACVCAALGYFSRLNPIVSAISLFGIFFITMIVEGTVYRGSHNLMPFEIAMYLWYALPGAIAGLITRWIRSKLAAVS